MTLPPCLLAVFALALLGGCPRPDSNRSAADPTTRAGDRTPALADGFEPAPALGPPPAPDPLAPGHDYLQLMGERIQPAWASFLEMARLRLPPEHPLNDAEAVAVLEIALEPSGALVGVRVDESSGVAELDQAAVEIVRAGAPYPAPPALWISDDDRVHVRWRFARDRRQAGVAGAQMLRLKLPIAEAIPRLLEAGRVEVAAGRLAREAGDDAAALVPLVDRVAVAALRRGVASDDPEVAAAAIEAAATARVTELAPALRQVAASAVAPGPRRAALRALGAIGDREALELLQAAAREGSPEDAAAATASLVALEAAAPAVELALAELGSELAERRARALAILSEAPAPPAVDAVAAMMSAKADRGEQRAAAAALAPTAAVQARAQRALVACLERGDAPLRAACAEALAGAAERGLRSRSAYWKVLALRRDADERVRAAALRAAARLDPARFALDLPARAPDSALVAEAMAAALAEVPGARALGHLLTLSRAEQPAVREAAARSLAARAEPRARARLTELLSDPAPAVRAAAIAAAADGDLDAHAADAALTVRVAAFRRLVVVRGRPAAVAAAAARLGETGSAQALYAGAWLASR